MTVRDWRAWHERYDDPGSSLALRLRAIQQQIAGILDDAPPGPLRAISICAGQGRDLLPVLAGHRRGPDVTARLVELDPELAQAAAQAAAAAGLTGVEVVTGDAGVTDAYAGLVPADLVLACGVFGNIPDPDIERTIATCRQLCQRGGSVVWTRQRREPDLVPQICDWFAARGFTLRWLSEPGLPYGAGVHVLAAATAPLAAGTRMFRFNDAGPGWPGPGPAGLAD